MKMSTLAVLGAQLFTQKASGETFNYKEHGDDWAADKLWFCGDQPQSPINLVTKTGKGFDYPILDGREDLFETQYQAQPLKQMKWTGEAVKYEFQMNTDNYFKSSFA